MKKFKQYTEEIDGSMNEYFNTLRKCKKLDSVEEKDIQDLSKATKGKDMSVRVENIFQKYMQSIKSSIYMDRLFVALDDKNKDLYIKYLDKNKINYDIDDKCITIVGKPEFLFLTRHELTSLAYKLYI